MKEIIIPFSKKKIIQLILGSIGFIAVCFWLIQIAETQTRYNPQFVIAVSILGVLFFGSVGIVNLVKFFERKQGLIINDEGIIDNSSAVCAGLIKWENITDVSITEVYRQKFITIHVNNAEEIIAKQSGLKKFFLGLNQDHYNSPVQLSTNALKCNFQELHDTIKEQLNIRHSTPKV